MTSCTVSACNRALSRVSDDIPSKARMWSRKSLALLSGTEISQLSTIVHVIAWNYWNPAMWLIINFKEAAMASTIYLRQTIGRLSRMSQILLRQN